MAAVLKMLIIRRHVRNSSTRFHIAGAVSRCEVRSVTFRGLESVVSSEVVLDRILSFCPGSGRP
jgi:hypothetical protein